MTTAVSTVVTAIRNTLQQTGNKASAKMFEKYFKNVLNFHGIRAPQLNSVFKDLYASKISKLETDDQLQVAYSLFDSKIAEEKAVGSMILTKNTKKLGVEHLPRLEQLIDDHIYDWGTADKFSGQVLFFMIKQDKKVPALIAKWKDADNIWRKRVSCVSFVKLARHGKYNGVIYDICSTTVKCNERFVQLGTGWVLRELSLADLSGVKMFIKNNYEHISREGLRYAIEKMNGQDKAKLLAYSGSASSEEISEALSESAEPSDEDLVVPKKGKKVSKKRKIEEVSEDEEDEVEKPIRTRSAKVARRK